MLFRSVVRRLLQVNGVNGTNGLNAGLPKADIEMIIPAASFNGIGGIDFQIDFQRDESRGDFITCGSTFAFGIDGGNLFVSFEVLNNASGSNLVHETGIYSVPNDDIFRTYRFYYLPATGYAEIMVDGAVVWNYYIGNPSNLNWPNNDVILGYLMDGNGNNKTIFDNVIIGEVYDSALPVEMTIFDAKPIRDKVEIRWETESELNSDYFTIERSQNGEKFHKIATVEGAGTTNDNQIYSYFDENPLIGISYYRLVQTDFNGHKTTSNSISVLFELTHDILIFPNLLETQAEFHIKLPVVGEKIKVVFFNELGENVLSYVFDHKDYLEMNAPNLSGTYMVEVLIDDEVYGVEKIIVK